MLRTPLANLAGLLANRCTSAHNPRASFKSPSGGRDRSMNEEPSRPRRTALRGRTVSSTTGDQQHQAGNHRCVLGTLDEAAVAASISERGRQEMV